MNLFGLKFNAKRVLKNKAAKAVAAAKRTETAKVSGTVQRIVVELGFPAAG